MTFPYILNLKMPP